MYPRGLASSPRDSTSMSDGIGLRGHHVVIQNDGQHPLSPSRAEEPRPRPCPAAPYELPRQRTVHPLSPHLRFAVRGDPSPRKAQDWRPHLERQSRPSLNRPALPSRALWVTLRVRSRRCREAVSWSRIPTSSVGVARRRTAPWGASGRRSLGCYPRRRPASLTTDGTIPAAPTSINVARIRVSRAPRRRLPNGIWMARGPTRTAPDSAFPQVRGRFRSWAILGLNQ